MKTWNDFIDWITKKRPSVTVNLVLPGDFPYNTRQYYDVSITTDEIFFVGAKGRGMFFQGKLKVDLNKK